LPPLAIASIGAHWDRITGSPNELIISLTNFSVKLNTPAMDHSTAIKNTQYASWPGLSAVDAVHQHFPESDETHKGHGRKTPSRLRSKNPKENETIDSDNDF